MLVLLQDLLWHQQAHGELVVGMENSNHSPSRPSIGCNDLRDVLPGEPEMVGHEGPKRRSD